MTYPELDKAVTAGDQEAILRAADQIRIDEERWWIDHLVRCCENARTLAKHCKDDASTVLACQTLIHTFELILFEALKRAH